MRTPLVIGNWKMHGTIPEARALATGIRDGLKRPRGVEVAVCPPFTALAAVAEILNGTPIAIGAQNCHHDPSGAHTGEIAPPMLTELGCRFVLLGHSERRHIYGETDEMVAKKVRAALAADLTPIVCVGESEAQFLAGQAESVLAKQIAGDTSPLTAARDKAAALVIAYEPIWAIGTGRPATASHAVSAARVIRHALEKAGLPGATPILYGGSVTAANAREFAGAQGIDGALVGGASLKADEFADIVRSFA